MSAAQAGWRPGAARHNIWEIVVHAAYWKYAVWRRLTGEARGSFPLKGSNWFKRSPGGSEEEWQSDVALLKRMHQTLRESVRRLSPANLQHKLKGSTVTVEFLVTGAAAHDLYHAGQIQLLKKMSAKKVRGSRVGRRISHLL
jgi:hypothetical protein